MFGPKIPEITVEDLKHRIDNGNKPLMIDIRRQGEWLQTGVIDGIKLRTTELFIQDLNTTDLLSELSGKEIVVVCRTGNRSAQLTNALVSQTDIKAINLKGGIVDWKRKGFPVVQATLNE